MSSAEPRAHGRPGRPVAGSDAAAPIRRLLRTRPAESVLHRALADTAYLFRGDDYPQRLAEAAAGTQVPVTTGRRIAVVGTRGGAGRSTVAALLARIYAAMRADTVAAVDLAPGAGTLALRLGVPHAPPLETAAARLQAEAPDSLHGLAALLTAAGPANLLVTGRRRPALNAVSGNPAPPTSAAWTPAGPLVPPVWTPGGPAPGSGAAGEEPGRNVPDGASRISRAISRYCPITLFDCGAGLTDPGVLWAVENSHAAVFVTPASVAGVEDALEYAAAWRRLPGISGVPLLILVAQPAPGGSFSASREAGRLRRAGIDAVHLGHDRHLAAGVEVRSSLLSRRTRLEAATVASRVLSAACAPETRPRAESATDRNMR
ncbi:hypothetical protein OL239_14640 [Arthrobacter sp. ATA002]|uniref:hypothetical protein n=1 Tax=Arthrobacter sp. ATA002 TaxID=2991715 RepID=UPI0022A70DED|nr:hypothetical protein [Arthrobacter sp. ATA002]WAP51109.1 hypothetical protein OL239_14640 [Arthrobacter sp. ATA002]